MPNPLTLRKDVLGICNEVRRKLGLKSASTLRDDDHIIALVDYLNDVISEVADFGDWQELLLEVLTTVSSSINSYEINTGNLIENIREISFENQIAPMRLETIENMRRWVRTSAIGIPRFWTVMGVNVSSANPTVKLHPCPGPSENNMVMNALFYTKPRMYEATATDASAVPVFPSRLLTSGLLAEALKDEAKGTDNADYAIERQKFLSILKETNNRFNGDSGNNTFFRPAMVPRRS